MDLERLRRPEGPRLHRLTATESDLCDIVWSLKTLTPARTVSRIVRGRKAATTQRLFDEFAAVFQFPYYFGENWAALDECLADLEWLPAEAYIIFISNAAHLLASEPAEEFRHFLDLIQGVAEEWGQPDPEIPGRQTPKAFHVVLHATPEDEPALVRRLHEAGVSCEPLM